MWSCSLEPWTKVPPWFVFWVLCFYIPRIPEEITPDYEYHHFVSFTPFCDDCVRTLESHNQASGMGWRPMETYTKYTFTFQAGRRSPLFLSPTMSSPLVGWWSLFQFTTSEPGLYPGDFGVRTENVVAVDQHPTLSDFYTLKPLTLVPYDVRVNC